MVSKQRAKKRVVQKAADAVLNQSETHKMAQMADDGLTRTPPPTRRRARRGSVALRTERVAALPGAVRIHDKIAGTPAEIAFQSWSDWPVVSNSRQGTLTFVDAVVGVDPLAAEPTAIETSPAVVAKLDPPDEAGDQTVPMRSADRQRLHGKCKAVFRQTGYDHQGSYKNEAVLAATLFSILKIAQRVQVP